MTWLNWFMIACSCVFVAILGHALRTGVLMAHKGPDILRSERPKTFWISFAMYVLILGVTVFAAIRW